MFVDCKIRQIKNNIDPIDEEVANAKDPQEIIASNFDGKESWYNIVG